MAKIDQTLLADIGFVKGTGGWPHEVWVYEGYFWVHFGENERERYRNGARHIFVADCNRKQFFQLFLEAMRGEIYSSNESRDWED